MNDIEKAKQIKAFLIKDREERFQKYMDWMRSEMQDLDQSRKTLAEKLAEECVANGGAAFRVGCSDFEDVDSDITAKVMQLKYGIDVSNEAEFDMRRRGWGWEEYQLVGADVDPDPNDPRWCAAWTPPDPLHAQKGKRRDTKPKKKARKKVNMGRRDSRRK